MPVKHLIKTKVSKALRPIGLGLSSAVDRSEVDAFFSKIRPVVTQAELIRIGGEGDGGYLVPNDLDDIAACFSPGVDKVANFELDLASMNIRSFLADFSVDGPPVRSDLIKFDKIYLGASDHYPYTTLESWIQSKNVGDGDLILQMDIEGGEYAVLARTDSFTLRKFRIMVIEFHRLDEIGLNSMAILLNSCFAKILDDFEIVHIHPNNWYKPTRVLGYLVPPFIEITFMRKDRIKWTAPAEVFPHSLDRKCVEDKDDFSLPECWYRR